MSTGVYPRSKEHMEKFHKNRKNQVGSNHPQWKGGRPKCLDCGKTISRRGLIRCLTCYGKWRKGKNSPSWRGGLQKVKCLYCGKEFKVYPYRKQTAKCCSRKCLTKYTIKLKGHPMKGKTHSLESKQKMSIAKIGKPSPIKGRKGKLSHMWKGGISRDGYPFNFNNELKELIRKRDNYKCQKCGCPQEECFQKLSIHHIDYNKDNLMPNNLISLCRKCNAKVNFNRNYWETYFMLVVKQ